MKYQYKVIKRYEEISECELNSFGNKCWKLCNIIYLQFVNGNYYMYTFCRNVKDDTPENDEYR
jgi:hypothetical protein